MSELSDKIKLSSIRTWLALQESNIASQRAVIGLLNRPATKQIANEIIDGFQGQLDLLRDYLSEKRGR
ncbi:MAG: hypothetical protein SVV80_12600 [Planctomycetota bacterium]|nr:hypothetical protein [Planctomycetota bacterium]